MNTDSLFKVIGGAHPPSDRFKTALEKELIAIKRPRNYVLVESPRIADFAYFINGGFAMSSTFPDGKKTTCDFWKSGQVMVSCQSFFEQMPSQETIELLTPCDLLCVSYGSIQRLFETYPEATVIYRLIMNRYYQSVRNRLTDLQKLSASQRLEKLLTAFPKIEQIASQDNIATYIGIAPQSLSRLKRNMG